MSRGTDDGTVGEGGPRRPTDGGGTGTRSVAGSASETAAGSAKADGGTATVDPTGIGGETGASIMDYRGSIPLWRQLSYPHRRLIRRSILYLAVAALTLVILFPVLWILTSAIRPIGEVVTRNPSLIPTEVTTSHFRELFFDSRFPIYLRNTVIVTAGVVVLSTTFATLGGYGLTRIDIPRKRTFARGVLFTYMFPPVLLAIPMYILWSNIGLLNTYVGLILAITARVLPFSLWLMWKFFLNVPYSLEESAQMAGATRFQAFKDVALPMAKPGIIAVAILAFAFAWGDYTMALILMTDLDMFVITTGIEASFF
ncbi:carbohydrate ABC transporter permease, partial [Halovivax sp.]|uniref:carbohydrate ABC transporter permease n=1 Tax=Halovivax sp. TaxID=1935978 RepID=UPI0025C42498